MAQTPGGIYLVEGQPKLFEFSEAGHWLRALGGGFWQAHRDVPSDVLTLRLLVSYAYFQRVDLDVLIPRQLRPPYPAIMADSGAFTAWAQGERLRWQDYARWLHRYRHWFQGMVNLDVIGDAAASARHQRILEDAGLPVLPVFHVGEPWDVLEGLCERYAYIGLGGMVPYASAWKRVLMPWLVRCFRCGAGRTVFHGLGCTTWTVMRTFPWYSVDSSAWKSGVRYGTVPLFDWQRGTFQTIRLGDAASVARRAGLIRALGGEPHNYAERRRNTPRHTSGIAVLSYGLASAWLRTRWHGGHARGRRQDADSGGL